MSTLSTARNLVAVPVLVGSLMGSLTLSEPAHAADPDGRAFVVADAPRFSPAVSLSERVTLGPAAVMPVTSYRLTGRFGASSVLWSSTHTGLDFAAAHGSPIYSVVSGEVVETYYDGAYGNKTVIRDEDGTEWWYCHQDGFLVAPGEYVEAGQQIGAVGSTGNSTGPHLHLEVRPGEDSPVDPYAALLELGLQA
jgi:murein DD-endopeptidase MepM/ murein hydrolase activator NlpD